MAAVQPPLIAVVGPTAAGKSALALRLAAARPAEIVCCDSLQVYRGFDIGSAKAGRGERDRVPHHLLDVVEPGDGFSAAAYARLARASIAEIAGRGALALVVGGTGLYYRALFRGLFEGPPRDEELRRRLERLAGRPGGDRRLHRLVRRVDPEAAARIAPRDRVRLVRALEVFRATGRPLSEHHRAGSRGLEGFRTLLLGLDPGRERLRQAVTERARAMLAAGLIEETRGLREAHGPGLRPLSAIGYRQAVAVLDGRLAPERAEAEIVADTLRVAKRQRTWFRREPGIRWFAEADAALAAAREWLGAVTPSH